MTTSTLCTGSVQSRDGTTIGFHVVGEGPALLVVGGALSTGLEYLQLARLLAPSFTVHLIDRRGRGLSGPQGPGYSLQAECEDLLAVAGATDASIVFGHSFGGMVALEVARGSSAFAQVVAYEPGVPLDGAVRLGWLDDFETRLARGDRRGAFAAMVRGAGYAPAALSKMPEAYARLVLRLVIRGHSWDQVSGLLDACLAEHRLLRQLASEVDPERYRSVTAAVLLLGGGKSPSFAHHLLDELAAAMPDATPEILAGLDHAAAEQRPAAIAAAIAGASRRAVATAADETQ